MRVELTPEVLRDGSIGLRWNTEPTARSVTLLLQRTGAVPAVHSVQLTGETSSYRIDGLSRHQRYRIAMLAGSEEGEGISSWWNITPRQGLEPLREEGQAGLLPHLSRIERVTVMPQDARLTVFWQRGPGFVDKVVLDVRQHGNRWKQIEVDPEVRSLSLDNGRGVPLMNGRDYDIRLHTRFATTESEASESIVATPAQQGSEREANQGHAQTGLVFPSLSLRPEVRIFADEQQEGVVADSGPSLVCCHCQRAVSWNSYRLVCSGCGAEFIPNGRGAFLEVARLRFGTCQCCLPKKILVQRQGEESLACVHSGKEHIRMPGTQGFSLIEDLPFGLCQCCRPRKPLLRRRGGITCSKSGEKHQNEGGAWVLVPSQPVFDAAAIDDLLDAGMADICSTGVSRRSA